MSIDWKCYGTDEIVCPYCYYQFNDSWDCNDMDGCDMVCPECEEEFTLHIDFSVSYCTSKKKVKNEDDD